MHRFLLTVAFALLSGAALHAQAAPTTQPDAEAAYTRTVQARAEKHVARLNLRDPDKAARVRNIIANQYRSLRDIHDARNAKVKQVKSQTGIAKEAIAEQVKAEQDKAQPAIDRLHAEFLAKLSAELTPEQVDTIKDEMTYNVLNVTYNAYCDMLPNLTAEQKAYIKQQLTEAREKAMDGGSSEEKHGVFGKYKGRINNYLSKQGINMKQAENEWRERLKARRNAASQPAAQ